MSYLSHTLEYPPASLSVWLPDEGISSKFGKFPVNIRVVVATEAYREAWLQGPSAVVALPAACLVNTGPYRGTTLFSILLTGSSVIGLKP